MSGWVKDRPLEESPRANIIQELFVFTFRQFRDCLDIYYIVLSLRGDYMPVVQDLPCIS